MGTSVETDLDLLRLEGDYLRDFASAPERATPEAVERYARYLDAHDPGRADILRLQLRLAVAPTAAEAGAIAAQLGPMLERLRGPQQTWWKLVRMEGEVRHCGLGAGSPPKVRFLFRCPKRWEELDRTGEGGVRHCSECQQNVYRGDSVADVTERARAGQCVYVPPGVAQRAQSEATSSYLGRPDPLQCWADDVFDDDER